MICKHGTDLLLRVEYILRSIFFFSGGVLGLDAKRVRIMKEKITPKPVTAYQQSGTVVRLDIVVCIIGVLDSFGADDCPRSRTLWMQFFET
jgi:hypothetical protein